MTLLGVRSSVFSAKLDVMPICSDGERNTTLIDANSSQRQVICNGIPGNFYHSRKSFHTFYLESKSPPSVVITPLVLDIRVSTDDVQTKIDLTLLSPRNETSGLSFECHNLTRTFCFGINLEFETKLSRSRTKIPIDVRILDEVLLSLSSQAHLTHRPQLYCYEVNRTHTIQSIVLRPPNPPFRRQMWKLRH